MGGRGATIAASLARTAGMTSLQQLFRMLDVDKSNSISFYEFEELCKHMSLFLPPERSAKLFSMTDQRGNGRIDFDEFDGCIQMLQREMMWVVISELGVQPWQLALAFVGTCLFLFLLFVFIFLGILSFQSSDSFSACINSLLPM